MSRAAPSAFLAAALGFVFACSSCVITGGSSGGKPLPPPPGLVKVAMSEYRFEFNATVPRGRVVFQVDNVGAIEHALTLIQLPEDYPPLDEQLHSSERRGAATIGRVPAQAPGSGSRFAADLEPGRYGFVCFLTDKDGVLHALKGMNAEFRVQ